MNCGGRVLISPLRIRFLVRVLHLKESIPAFLVSLLRLNDDSLTFCHVLRNVEARFVEAAAARARALLRMLFVDTSNVSSQLCNGEEKSDAHCVSKEALCLNFSYFLGLCLGDRRFKVPCDPRVPQGLLCCVTLYRHGIAKLYKKVARHLRKIFCGAIFGHPLCWVASD